MVGGVPLVGTHTTSEDDVLKKFYSVVIDQVFVVKVLLGEGGE